MSTATASGRRAAVVTGSTSGIGLAIARALAGAGHDIMLNGFGDVAKIEVERRKLEQDFGVRALYSGADLTQPAQIAAMMAEAAAAFDSADVLVNNAGIQHVAPIDEFPVDKWDAVIAIGLTAAFHTTRAALPAMKARGMSEEAVVRDVMLAAQPTRQFVPPDEIGALVVYLASDAAAAMTGSAIPLDGGWTAQ